MTNQSPIKIPLKNTLNVSNVITILCYDLAPTYHNKGERHDFWEFVYIDRGTINVYTDNNFLHLSKGDIIFHRPNEFHKIVCNGKESASIFIITFDCHSAAMKFFYNKIINLPKELHPLMKKIIEESSNTFHITKYPLTLKEAHPFGGQQLLRIYIEELLLRLIRSENKEPFFESAFATREEYENTLAHRISEYLTEHIYSKLTIDMLTEHFHLGKSRLCDIFKKSYGDTIIHHYLCLKIEEAKRLLREKTLTISEISELLMFESAAYFSRIFKKFVGISPSSYRNSLIHVSAKYLESEEFLF
ncbi:MAG: AraC family transcriptional regulator [Clostridia bacterium]|nr:AraC family transcriptional regulator [Clostridia bacterium]